MTRGGRRARRRASRRRPHGPPRSVAPASHARRRRWSSPGSPSPSSRPTRFHLQDLAGWLYLALAATGLALCARPGRDAVPLPGRVHGHRRVHRGASRGRAREPGRSRPALVGARASRHWRGSRSASASSGCGRVPVRGRHLALRLARRARPRRLPFDLGRRAGDRGPEPRARRDGPLRARARARRACAASRCSPSSRGAPGLALAALRQRRRPPLRSACERPACASAPSSSRQRSAGSPAALGVQLAGHRRPERLRPLPVVQAARRRPARRDGERARRRGRSGRAVGADRSSPHWIGEPRASSSAARFDPMLFAILVLVVLGLGGAGIVPWLRRLLPWLRAPRDPPAAASAPPQTRRGDAERRGRPASASGASSRSTAWTLEARPGSIVALIGPNGSGKTTALRILSGTLAPDAGRLELDGRALDGAGLAARVELGVVRTLQRRPSSTELTALENVLVGAGAARASYGGALRTVLATPKARAEDRAPRSQRSPPSTWSGCEQAAGRGGGSSRRVGAAATHARSRARHRAARPPARRDLRRRRRRRTSGDSRRFSSGCARRGSRSCSSSTTCGSCATSPRPSSSSTADARSRPGTPARSPRSRRCKRPTW